VNNANRPRLGNTTGATRALAGARGQIRASDQDMEALGMRRLKCAAHLIEYYLGEQDRPICPMCELERKWDEAKVEYLEMRGQLKAATEEVERLKVQVEIGTAIKSAIGILDDNDYAWLKTQMYQYKIDKSVHLKPIHDASGIADLQRGEKLPANGFMAIPRAGDPEAHRATSIGGIAMAGYLDEALTCYGAAQGMGIMLKAWWQVLPGAQG
jgi:hypothetical protein